jgi:hypothetical protein
MRRNRYRMRCSCGGEIVARASAAGALLKCPVCHALTEAPCLSDLRRLPPAAASDGEGAELQWFQFSIAQVLQWTAVVGVVCTYARLVNSSEAVLIGVLLVSARLWLGNSALLGIIIRIAFLFFLFVGALAILAVLFLRLFL